MCYCKYFIKTTIDLEVTLEMEQYDTQYAVKINHKTYTEKDYLKTVSQTFGKIS